MKRVFVSSAVFLLPLTAFAATATDIFAVLSKGITDATPVVVGLAVLLFLWGLSQYILAAGDETKKAEGRNIMIYGIIALFVMVSVWGLVKLVQTTLGIDAGTTPSVKGFIPTT